MNPAAANNTPDNLGSSWLRRAKTIERFEERWQQCGEADVAEFVSENPAGPGRAELLRELIKVDLEYRWRRGDRLHVESYVTRFPELRDCGEMPIDLISEEIRVRRLHGCPPTTEELLRRFPDRRSELQQLADGLATVEAAGAGDLPNTTPSIEHTADLPRRLGHYELVERIGSGGFSTVYRARDTELRREVAIKVPRAELMEVPGARGRVQREAQTAARLRHPAIVPIYEVGQDGGTTYIVYEFIRGPTLAQLLKDAQAGADISPTRERGTADATPAVGRGSGAETPSLARRASVVLIAPQQAAEWVARLAEALDYAHQNGIVHRDVKSANVLMDERGQPMLTDFGLALQSDAAATLTQHGDILGTPAYMSPELARGEGHSADARTDVYSLGVVLYELLCGRLPFQGTGPSVLHKVIHDEPAPPRQSRPHVPLDLETICLKAMAKEPARRYSSAGAMAEDLRAYLEHRPIRARRIGPLGRLVRWCRRRPAVAATIAAATLVCVVIAAVSIRRVVAERDAARFVSASLAFDRAQQLGSDGEAGQGLLWLVRSLELLPADAEDLRGAVCTNLGAWQQSVARPELLLEHRGPVQAVAWSADGRIIVTGSDDKTVRVWEAATGQPLGEPLLHEHEVMSVVLSLDRTIAVTGDLYGTVLCWDLTTSRVTGAFRAEAGVNAVSISLDGQTIAAGAGNGKAYLWNRATGDPIGEPLAHNTKAAAVAFNPVHAVAFSADGRVTVTASHDGVIHRWNAATGDPISTTDAVVHGVNSVYLFRGGESALVCRSDNTVTLLDLTSDPIAEPSLPIRGLLRSSAISSDSRLLVTGGADRTARLWDAQTLSPLGAPLRHPDRVLSVAFSPDTEMVITGCEDGFARVWRISGVKSGGAALELQHDAPVWAMAFSSDGGQLFTGCGWRHESGSSQLWNAHTGERVGPPLPIGVQQLGVAISPDGRTLATGHWNGLTQLWDAASGKPIGEPFAPVRERIANVTLTAFSPDGKTLMTSSFVDNSPQFWDVATRQPIAAPPRLDHGHVVRAAVWSRDGKLILTGGGDGAAKLWDVATGRQVVPAMQHPGQVGTVALSNDNRFVLVGTDADRAQLWDATTGQPIGPPLEHKGTVRGVAFSPDGRLMATASWDRTARLWDRATGKPIGPPLLHDREVEAVTFSPDGRQLVTASWDKTVRFWTVPSPLEGTPNHLRLWAEVLTNMELDANGAIHLLPANSWRDRRDNVGAAPAP